MEEDSIKHGDRLFGQNSRAQVSHKDRSVSLEATIGDLTLLAKLKAEEEYELLIRLIVSLNSCEMF